MSQGLRRFVGPQPEPVPVPGTAGRERPRAAPGEVCEMCAEPVGGGHSHVVNLDSRQIMCTCRACYLLFTHQGAAGGRYRAVPDRYLHDPEFQLDDGAWETLQIPVKVAFLFDNSDLGRVAAFYPSPAGATESLLSLEAWQDVVAANPAMTDLVPDVEALLVQRTDEGFECFLVPIDACYELVGLVRMHWKGFDGGEEAWAAIDGFFDAVRERSRPVEKREVDPS
ncbi:MAG TPA: DUF5947 family protein [Actinomycetota bacterium]|nr:DUF5947 family protein [Actinomycetota bacterium]